MTLFNQTLVINFLNIHIIYCFFRCLLPLHLLKRLLAVILPTFILELLA